MTKRLLVALLLLIPLASSFQAEELSEKSYDRIRDYLLPKGDEEAWKKVEWRSTFWDGVMDAQKEDKPIMLFAMNGHPFGCT
ncbi:MAG: hypothetical protein KDB32_02340 [Planctomycetes bacterium]|nr:hypothetical protein [Planctomycetota bacterium]